MIEAVASGIGNTIGFAAETGILFAAFALLWLAFGAALVWSQGSLDAGMVVGAVASARGARLRLGPVPARDGGSVDLGIGLAHPFDCCSCSGSPGGTCSSSCHVRSWHNREGGSRCFAGSSSWCSAPTASDTSSASLAAGLFGLGRIQHILAADPCAGSRDGVTGRAVALPGSSSWRPA